MLRISQIEISHRAYGIFEKPVKALFFSVYSVEKAPGNVQKWAFSLIEHLLKKSYTRDGV